MQKTLNLSSGLVVKVCAHGAGVSLQLIADNVSTGGTVKPHEMLQIANLLLEAYGTYTDEKG
jgi:hypothetical protein